MKVYDAATLRNVAIVGHSGSGKTQLVSALLFDAGATNRFGKVDDGTTLTDYDDEEIHRKHTLSAALAHIEWRKHKINFIDTPGMGNFLGDARAALRRWRTRPTPACSCPGEWRQNAAWPQGPAPPAHHVPTSRGTAHHGQ